MTHLPDSFTLSLKLDLSAPAPGDLVRLGESIHIFLREAGTEAELAKWDRIGQNYLSFPMPDGRALVLEVVVRYDTQDAKRKTQRIGFPLALLPQSGDIHVVELRVSPVHLQLLADDALMDEEWPVSRVLPEAREAIRGERVIEMAVHEGTPEVARPEGHQVSSLQYYSPPGHNAWAGDTMCTVHEGRFHLFYLLDRRHHTSKFGTGSHSISHAVSEDLRNWKHLPQAMPIQDSWLTCGTGIPIVRDGRILLFFGMHTDRIVPHEQTTAPQQMEDLKREGVTAPLGFFHEGKYPQGTVVASSSDGVRFELDRTIIHPCQNPSPFIDPATGKVYLLAGYGDSGLYESADLRHWRRLDAKFTPCNEQSPFGNTLECQCLFEWNGWYYLLAGRTGFWMSRSALGPFWSGAANAGADTRIYTPRWDIYDGLWVPMVAPWAGNRRILCGWLAGPDFGWGGHLVFRELVQHPDGTLGTRWVPEMVPSSGSEVRSPLAFRLEANAGTAWIDGGAIPGSCHITMRILPECNGGCFGLRIGSAELKFSPATGRVQWATNESSSPAPDLPALEEILAAAGNPCIWKSSHPNLHFNGGDFTIQNVECVDRPFTLELLAIEDAKSSSTLIDICIDGRRTMITRRAHLKATTLRLFAQNASLRVEGLTIRPLLLG